MGVLWQHGRRRRYALGVVLRRETYGQLISFTLYRSTNLPISLCRMTVPRRDTERTTRVTTQKMVFNLVNSASANDASGAKQALSRTWL